jgi:hypothetical protein
VTTDLKAAIDDFDEYLTEALRDPSFRAAWDRARLWDLHHPLPLAIDGREYRRRQRARRKRR